MDNNRIIGVSGGLFSVETEEGTVQAASRGIFRQNGIKPVTGDYVRLKWEENSQPVISEVLERKNVIVRPPLANLDMAVLVVSSCEPAPNAFVLDKLTAVFESKGIETVFVFTKIDRKTAEDFGNIYNSIGYKTFMADNTNGRGTEEISRYIEGKTAALIGNSGVGKSSLMNYLVPNKEHKTSEISKKLGRGKHTTREVRLYRTEMNAYIADTPGFSTVEVSKYVAVPSKEVADCFREIEPFTEKCRFKDCAHIKETDCAVREALAAGKIARSRYDSYCKIYEEAVKKEHEY